MQSLTVCTFEGSGTAVRALPRVQRLVVDDEIAVDDAAVVSFLEEAVAPTVHPVGSMTGPGRLWNGFWAMLGALLFLVPAAAPALGAAAGAFAGSMASFGVPDDFLMRVREAVVPGTSALFILSPGASADRLEDELEERWTRLIRADLSEFQARRLYDLLGAAATVPRSTSPTPRSRG